jgi:hypothetical protein
MMMMLIADYIEVSRLKRLDRIEKEIAKALTRIVTRRSR